MAKDKKDQGIENIIYRAVESGRISAERSARDAFKATERRLYAVPDLRAKLKDDQEELEDTRKYGLKERSHSITRFFKSGVRLTPEEIMEAVIIDLEAAIAATSHELEALDKALASIRDDPYYLAVDGKYIQRMNDEDIAEKIHCDPSTVWRNRKRLVQRVAVRLYGVDAVK